jgi:RNA-directed DNA polymerase
VQLPAAHFHVERWLKAPIVDKQGQERPRTRGTPQGGVISPLLAKLFLHSAFDKWMGINISGIEYARYADDIIMHRNRHEQVKTVLERVRKRLSDC